MTFVLFVQSLIQSVLFLKNGNYRINQGDERQVSSSKMQWHLVGKTFYPADEFTLRKLEKTTRNTHYLTMSGDAMMKFLLRREVPVYPLSLPRVSPWEHTRSDEKKKKKARPFSFTTNVHGLPTLGEANTSRIGCDVFRKVHPLVSQRNKRNFKLPSLSLFCINIFSIKMHERLARHHGDVCTALHARNSADAYLTLKSCVFSRLYCYGRGFGRQNCRSDNDKCC